MHKDNLLKVGDIYQYNKKYKESELVTIIDIYGDHVLIKFPSGTKICTRISGLWPLKDK